VAQALLLAAIVVAGLVGPAWEIVGPWLGIPVGAALLALGGALALAGARGLGPGLSPFPRPRERAALVERGIYARARHPIYGGLMVGAVGWSVLTGSLAALVLSAALVVFFFLKARHEEELLSERFPDYDEYRRRTPRRFFPLWL
jgi:protein-S-isoprenylcysteine O-methyltransferase Ste14